MTTDFTRWTTVTPPASEPVTLAEAMAQVRVVDESEQDQVEDLIQTAREMAERYVARALVKRTLKLTLDAFPSGSGSIRLPMPPLVSVSSVKYTDTEGVEQTLSSSLYQVDTASEPARIVPAYGQVWPSTRDELNAVRVEYVAGYGDDATEIPWRFKQAVLLILGDLYEHRETTVVGTISSEIESVGVRNLLGPERVKMEF